MYSNEYCYKIFIVFGYTRFDLPVWRIDSLQNRIEMYRYKVVRSCALDSNFELFFYNTSKHSYIGNLVITEIPSDETNKCAWRQATGLSVAVALPLRILNRKNLKGTTTAPVITPRLKLTCLITGILINRNEVIPEQYFLKQFRF